MDINKMLENNKEIIIAVIAITVFFIVSGVYLSQNSDKNANAPQKSQIEDADHIEIEGAYSFSVTDYNMDVVVNEANVAGLIDREIQLTIMPSYDIEVFQGEHRVFIKSPRDIPSTGMVFIKGKMESGKIIPSKIIIFQ